ncbi:MAG: hypothetical protein ABI282_09410 [Candidatus Baltobacteraceae bacterium]
MNHRLGICLFVLAVAVTACGGGGSGSGGYTTPPVPQPSSTVPAGTGNLPLSQTVAGAPAWVDPTSSKTLYYLDVDTAAGGTCTGGCLAVWPTFTPSSGAQSTGNVTIVTRSDGTGMQWAYVGHPLYTFTGDSGADQANGDNFPDFGGHWHVARPSLTTPTPGGTPPPKCTGGYC